MAEPNPTLDLKTLATLNTKVEEARASGDGVRIERARNDRYSWLEDHVPAILAALEERDEYRSALRSIRDGAHSGTWAHAVAWDVLSAYDAGEGNRG